jgi:hypothetical protein
MITSLSRYTLYFTAALVSERVKLVKGRGGGLNGLKEVDGRRWKDNHPIIELPQMLGLFGRAASAGVMHRRQMSIRWSTAEGYGRSATTRGATMRKSQNRSTA